MHASAVLTAFAVPAMAQEATPDGFANVTSSASRDAVRADAVAARKAGLKASGQKVAQATR
jgi:hypothetical protein